ncbi:MAG: CotH kinase family protein [Prevotella sp.]|nr:CotH kinase family protein [Prevotella sp.]
MKKNILLFIIFSFSLVTSALAKSQWETAISEYNEYSLPLVNVVVDVSGLKKESYIPGHITIVDAEMRTEGRLMASFDCKLRYRGASSLKYEKKSFAIKLLDSDGEDLDANVFGIRKENDWILDAMAIDRIRMRNRVCFDIWNEISKTPYKTDFDNRNGTLGQFVEVYLNGEYHGLYCMTDKIDRKLLGLKKPKEQSDGSVYIRGVLYKGEAWTDATRMTGYDISESFDVEAWNGWELQYPDDYPCYDAWKPLMNLIDFCNTRNAFFKLHYRQHFYYDNLVDYALFIMGLNIIDNNVKNTHFSCPDINVNETYLITPWDLDCSLGGLYEGSHYEEYTKITELTSNYLYYQLYVYNVDNFRGSMKERWQELLSGIMSPDNFNARLDAYAKRFKESGAWQREYDRWNNNPVPLDLDTELEYVKNWYVKNIAAMNKTLGVIADDIPYVFQDRDSYNMRMYNIDGKRIMSNPFGRRIYIESGRKIIR